MRYVIMFSYKNPIQEQEGFYCLNGIRRAFLVRDEAVKKATEVARANPDKIIYVSMLVDSVQVNEPVEHNSFF